MSLQCHVIPSLYLYFPSCLRTIFFKLICVNQNLEEVHTLHVAVLYPSGDPGHALPPDFVVSGFALLYTIGFVEENELIVL